MVRRPGAIELLAGLAEDPVFGPVVVFGQGGTAVEVIDDSAIGLPPLNPLLARAQMTRTRVWRLLQGYRGRPPAAIDAIAEVLDRHRPARRRASRELSSSTSTRCSPMPPGVIAIDARIRVAPAQVAGAARLAIAPYPKELQSTERLRDGTEIELRPAQPEDEPLLA